VTNPPIAADGVLTDGHCFTEDPRWRGDRLWYSDFYAHEVHSVGTEGDDRVEVALDDQPSGLGWLPDGRLLIVSMTERKVVRREPDGTLVEHADLSDIATWWCNDMLVDPQGRAYVGHFGFDLDTFLDEHGEAGVLAEPGPPRAHVVLVHPDGVAEVAADDMRFPNGTVLTPDGGTLIVAETLGLRLSAFDVGADGRLANRRVWADLSSELIPPDGICLDAEGAVWAANALGPTAVRILEGGEITDRVLFDQNVFACALGGPDGTTLFACTAPDSHAGRRSGERRARIEVATVEVPGVGVP
jgi:sugar lactone lactonase YvrE